MAIPEVGQIWGNYQLKRFIAKGGFGWVFSAEHTWLKSQVAIKILDTNPHRFQKDVELFLAEAQKLQTLRHPNIAGVKDFGIANEMPYLVMPLYQASLAPTRGSTLPLPTIVLYVQQVATALHYVHQHQLVHRDIKPENLLVGKDGEIILSDFGITTMTHSIAGNQEYAGTAAYMPPEQWRGKAVRASDQYALAIMVYQWVCGELPFQGTVLEVMGQHINLQPPSLRVKNTLIPEDVEHVVMKALAKDPLQRFPTIVEFAEALGEAANSLRLELLLTIPIKENDPIMEVQWVWGNHYLLIIYEDGKMQIIDVLSGNTVSSTTFDNKGFSGFIRWNEENCTADFDQGAIKLIDTTNTWVPLIDTHREKQIGALLYDGHYTCDSHASIYRKQILENKKIIALADSWIKADFNWLEYEACREKVYRDYSVVSNIISNKYTRECFCLPHWHYFAVARIDKLESISKIEVLQVMKH